MTERHSDLTFRGQSAFAGDYPATAVAIAAGVADIGASPTTRVSIGAGSITSLGSVANRVRLILFTGAGSIAHNATSLVLPGGLAIAYEAGDYAIAESDGAGNWRVIHFLRSQQFWTLNIALDGGGAALAAGRKVRAVDVPVASQIVQWTIVADAVGSLVLDIWKASYANAPATVSNTITAAAKPTLSSAAKAQSSTLTGWTTAVAQGDNLVVNVDSATTVQEATLALRMKRAA